MLYLAAVAGASGVRGAAQLITKIRVACAAARSGFSAIPALFLVCAAVLTAMPSRAEEAPQRLSDWLSGRAYAADDYPLGLLWEVPGEEAAQARLKSDLLARIDAIKGDDKARARLHEWVAQMPVTGRVPVAIVDADWLRANPKQDPVILPGQRVILPKRPNAVTVITSRGMRCQVTQSSGVMAYQYIAGCDPASRNRIDWAWIVQPDGTVRRFGIARWNANAQKQDELAPGSWLWAPYRDDKWAQDLSGRLTAFLATQGIAPESGVSNAPEKAERNDAIPDRVVTANDWGAAGLLQTPTARMRDAGEASMTLSRVYPYTRLNFFLQPFDWLEFGFRYTSISNRLYGPAIAGGQAYKDKSLDVKFGLLEESAYLPQVALGLRDVTGTGLFSGEFLAASKRTGPFDFSLGLGWGYVGGRGNLRNPLSAISPGFDARPVVDIGQGGNFSVGSYFHGRTALFGGVEYQSPWEPLSLKLEYDGNNYQHEPLSNNLPRNSPWNVGAVYHAGPGVQVSLGLERGNTVMLSLTLQTDFKKYATPKLDDPAPIPAAVTPSPVAGDVMARDLQTQTGWAVSSIEQNGRVLRVKVDDAEAFYWGDRLDRAAAALNRDAAGEIDSFHIVQRQHGVALVEQEIDRNAWVAQSVQPLPPSEQHAAVVTRPAGPADSGKTQGPPLFTGASPAFEAEPALGMGYNLGGPNGFILYQLYAEERARLALGPSTWMQGRLDLNLLNNYNHFAFDAASNLPRVRTYIREYLTSSNLTMPNLQLTHVGKVADNQYYSMYGGYLEMMFAGVGGEWMYRSYASPVAFGIDVNRVRQREFQQHLDLLRPAYQVDTGHATLYWDTGWNNVLATVSAGRYLAGDVGMTFDLSRVFQNGVRMGAFFTKTNVSVVQFGEGSFDKGVYLNIPFDAMFTKSSGKSANILWQPLIRDGGDKLNREVRLYDVTRLLDSRTMQYRPADTENQRPVPSQLEPRWDE